MRQISEEMVICMVGGLCEEPVVIGSRLRFAKECLMID